MCNGYISTADLEMFAQSYRTSQAAKLRFEWKKNGSWIYSFNLYTRQSHRREVVLFFRNEVNIHLKSLYSGRIHTHILEAEIVADAYDSSTQEQTQ